VVGFEEMEEVIGGLTSFEYDGYYNFNRIIFYFKRDTKSKL